MICPEGFTLVHAHKCLKLVRYSALYEHCSYTHYSCGWCAKWKYLAYPSGDHICKRWGEFAFRVIQQMNKICSEMDRDSILFGGNDALSELDQEYLNNYLVQVLPHRSITLHSGRGVKYVTETRKCDNNTVCAIYPLHTGPLDIDPIYAHFLLCARDLVPPSEIQLPKHFKSFTCADGSLIAESLQCDGISDCPGTEDEALCSSICTVDNINCSSDCKYPECRCNEHYYYQCIDGGCMTFDTFCNGQQDCPQGEDEQGCVMTRESKYVASTTTQIIDIATGFCEGLDSYLPCTSLTECYSLQSLCHYDTRDGIILYCADGTHLGAMCTHHVCNYEYKCFNSYCIPTGKVCIFLCFFL